MVGLDLFHLNIVLPDRQISMKLDLNESQPSDSTILSFLTLGQLYENDVADIMIRAVRPGDLLIDVGANLGYFTLLMAFLTGPGGHVLSCEPTAGNVARLIRHLDLNELHNAEIIPHPMADAATEIEFWFNSDNAGGHAIWDVGQYPTNIKSRLSPHSVRVHATTIDQEVAERGGKAPRLIKIDTEGAEHTILRGATKLLAAHAVPYIVTELHNFGLERCGSSQAGLRDFMREFGYDMFLLYPDGALPKLIPPGTFLSSPVLVNVVFSTPDDVAALWPAEHYQPPA
jgi:FkbM family methyltransferase